MPQVKVSKRTINTVLGVKYRMDTAAREVAVTGAEWKAIKRLYDAVKAAGEPIPVQLVAAAQRLGLE